MAEDRNKLVTPIEGYVITITNQNKDDGEVVLEIPLRINQVGGAHLTNPDDLVMMIEDAVYNDRSNN